MIINNLFFCVLGDLREELDRLAKTCSDQQQLIHQAINKAPGTLSFNLSHRRLGFCTFFKTQALILCVLSQTECRVYPKAEQFAKLQFFNDRIDQNSQ